MCKFENIEDQGYQDVMGEILRWTKGAREEATATTVLQEGTR